MDEKIWIAKADKIREAYARWTRSGSHDITEFVADSAELLNGEKKDPIATAIVEILLMLPADRRGAVIDAIQYNGLFCWHCGIDYNEPFEICHCTNDE